MAASLAPRQRAAPRGFTAYPVAGATTQPPQRQGLQQLPRAVHPLPKRQRRGLREIVNPHQIPYHARHQFTTEKYPWAL